MTHLSDPSCWHPLSALAGGTPDDPVAIAPDPVIQLVGACAILLAYLALQVGRTGPRDIRYLAANTIGAGLLAFEAARTRQIGFLLLEGTWAIASLVSWIRVHRSARRDGARPS